jgi:DNA-binding response OmpR family regulator
MARTALIVEDDTILSELLAVVLKQMDFQPTVLHEGTDAAARVRELRPDVVLLDLMLPGRNGYDICQELKLDRETNRTPIIICTARTQHEDLLQGLRVGANFYLTKPFTIDQLHHAVEHVLGWRTELEAAGAAGEVHFQLQSDTQYIEELNRMLSSLFLFSGLTQDQVFELTTAVREMGNNAIEWGNRKHVDKPVTVTYRIDSEKVVIVIRDEGPGFNRSDLAHAAREDDPCAHMDVRETKGLRPGGFGIFMTRGLVDDLQYNETGNEVRLTKRFSKAPARAE